MLGHLLRRYQRAGAKQPLRVKCTFEVHKLGIDLDAQELG